MEVLNWRASIAGLAGEQGVANVAFFQLGFDQAQHGGELRKQQNASTFGEQFIEHVQQTVELARSTAFLGRCLANQSQVTAHLAKFEQRFKNNDLATSYPFTGDFVADFFVHRQAHGFVHVTLRFVQINPVDDLGFRRQFSGHLFFGAAQQEGFDPRIQVLQALVIAMAFDGYSVVAVKVLSVAQPARHQEVKQRPQFAQVVFQWRTGKAQALACNQLAGRL